MKARRWPVFESRIACEDLIRMLLEGADGPEHRRKNAQTGFAVGLDLARLRCESLVPDRAHGPGVPGRQEPLHEVLYRRQHLPTLLRQRAHLLEGSTSATVSFGCTNKIETQALDSFPIAGIYSLGEQIARPRDGGKASGEESWDGCPTNDAASFDRARRGCFRRANMAVGCAI